MQGTTIGAIVEAKLYPGFGAARVMKRPRLALPHEFHERTISVAMVCAPAGYGKSTLMGIWHEALNGQGLACGWLSLDPDDNDPARLMRHLIAAFQRIDPNVGRGAMNELTASVTGGVKPALESLAADLGQIEQGCVVFLDDLHFLSSSEALDLVDWLIHYSPRHCQYVLGSRAGAQIRLAHLRVRGRLAEYGVAELQFSTEECKQFLEGRLGRVLGQEHVQQLLAKTEGWPAALELAALALRTETEQGEVIRRFAGSVREVVDYLSEAILNRLDPRIRGFITRLAQFERFNAELAEAVTSERDAAALLGAVHAGNLFLVPLDHSSRWFRFHHIAAEFLQERFRREGGDAKEVLLSGARWLYQNGYAHEGINAAIGAEAWDLATRWVAESAESSYRQGYHQTIMRWMQRLPAEWVDRFPTIRIHYAFALIMFAPRQQEVEAQVRRLEDIHATLVATGGDLELAERIECEVELQKVLSLALRDDGDGARSGAQAWLERWPDAPLVRRGTMGNVLTFGLKTAGEIDSGLDLGRRVRGWLNQAESWYSLSWTDYLAALLHMKRGAYLEARQFCEAGLALLRDKLDSQPANSAMFHATLAMVAYEFDELDRANAHIEQSMPRVLEYGQADAVLMGALIAAKLERMQRGEEAGLELLREGQEAGVQRGFFRVTVSLAAEECIWHARAGRLDAASRIAAQHGFDRLNGRSENSGLTSGKAILAASRFLLRSEPDKVLEHIGVPIERCKAKGLYRRWVELLLIKAVAHREDGTLVQAEHSLKEALFIAGPRKYFRVILDEALDITTLLDRLDLDELAGSPAGSLARRLRRAISEQSDGQVVRRATLPQLVENLSRRELAILKRLESELSNKEIARAFFISEGTLKWHLHNIYGKLGVKGRAGAVRKAHALSVI